MEMLSLQRFQRDWQEVLVLVLHFQIGYQMKLQLLEHW